jgi:thioester reductase-like protein
LGVELPLVALFEATTVTELARRIDRAGTAGPASSGSAEDTPPPIPVLDPEIRVTRPRPRSAVPRAVLLTGATGFLGAHLLHRLLEETPATVHCLVRCDSPEEGRARLLKTVAEYGLVLPGDGERVIVEPGDLGRPLLGLSAQRFDLLAERLDAVHHSGAWVSFTLPYEMLRAANVTGTEEVLRLAARGGGIPVQHISTASVPEPGSGTGTPVAGGYNQSKWVAEHLAVAARERGLRVDVHRPDYVGGHSETGIGNAKDLIWAVVKGSVQLGCYPDLGDLPVGLVPVDLVTRAVVRHSLREDDTSASFDLAHPEPVSFTTVFGWVRAFGYDIRRVPHAEWLAALRASAEESWDNALFPFLGLLAGSAPTQTPAESAPPTAGGRPAYEAADIPCPPLDEALLRTYLTELVHSGYLPAPPGRPLTPAQENA